MTSTEARPRQRHFAWWIGGLYVLAVLLRYVDVVLGLAAFVVVIGVCVQAWRKGTMHDQIIGAVMGGLALCFMVTLIFTTHWH